MLLGCWRQKVVHISQARRRYYDKCAPIGPPYAMPGIWVASVPEQDRALIMMADMRADMRIGDLGLRVLCKAHYHLEAAGEALKSQEVRETFVVWIIEVIRDYGEPQGVALLDLALDRHGNSSAVCQAVSLAASRIALPHQLGVIIAAMKRDHPSIGPDAEALQPHLRALAEIRDRFPELGPRIAAALPAGVSIDVQLAR